MRPRPETLLAVCIAALPALRSQDCNGNSIDDGVEIAVTFAFAEPLRFAVPSDVLTLAAADANGDGRPDLAAACAKANVAAVLESDPSSERLFREPVQLCAGLDPRGIAWARRGGEGEGIGLDLVVGSEGRQGQDPGALRATLTVLARRDAGGFESDCTPPCTAALPARCAAGDFDAFLQDADGIRTLEAADLDHDGGRDVVLGLRRSPGAVLLLFGDARGGFDSPRLAHSGALRESRYVAVSDLDGDGELDIATGGGDILFGPHRRGRDPDPPQPLGEVAGDPRGLSVADVDGDGRTDVILSSSRGIAGGSGAGSLLVFAGRGGRRFEPVAQPDLEQLCDILESVAAADLDGDGDVDLVVPRLLDPTAAACGESGLEILGNDGSGSFSFGKFLPVEPARPRWVIAADLDADGRADLAAAVNRGGGELDEVMVFTAGESRGADRDRNGLPDDCQFLRGDVDGDRRGSITDPIALLGFLFVGGPAPGCLEACDADNDGKVALADAVTLLLHLFQGGPPPGPPAVSAGGGCQWPEAWIDANGLLSCDRRCGIE